MKRNFLFAISLSGQWIAVVVGVAGIIVELALRARIGYILITTGSFTFAIFTKLRYYFKKNDFLNF